MRHSIFRSLLFVVAVAFTSTALADGTQSGSIGGTVKDSSGGAMPGVQISAKNVKSGFARDAISGGNGSYSLRLLPVGEYTVTVALAGFQTVSSVVKVDTEKNTQFDPVLKLSAVTDTITVSAELPVVDMQQTNTQTTVASDFTQKLAVGRSYQSLLNLAPGVGAGSGGNPNVHGSLTSGNVYLFDGVDTTDTTTGTFGQNFNFEAIQEVAVNTGSFSAEYGRATGGVVSVVTKSGGNEYHGSLKALATNDKWNGQNYQLNQTNGASLQRPIFDEIQWRESVTLGGPFVRDNLWFFGAFEYAKATSPAAQTLLGENYQQSTTLKIWSGKVTWAATSQHTLEVSANGDPFDGIIRDYWGATAEVNALTAQDQGGHVYRANYQGVFSAALSAEATFATSTSHIGVGTQQTSATAPFYVYRGANVTTTQKAAPHFDLSQNLYFNGATFTGDVDRPRTQFNLAANYYKQIGATNNNFRIGFDYQKLESGASFAYPDNAVYYDDSFDIATRRFTPNELQVFAPATASTSKGNIYSLYLLDKLNVGRFFVNVGFRVDKQDGSSDVGRSTFDKTTFSPRIFFKFDVSGNGKQLVSGGYGRFYQSLIQGFADGFAAVPQQGIYDDYFFDAATGRYVLDSHVDLGGNSTPVNLGLRPTYTDDVTLAFEQQLSRVFGVSVRGTYRKWNDLIDDVRTFSGGVRSLQYVNYDGASRRYRGLEFVLDKRFANNWQALLSYTLSKTEGNHFADYSSALGDYLDNRSSASTGSLTGLQVNEANKYGVANYDQTHDIKGYGAYTFPLGPVRLNLGSTLGLRSGTTYQQQRTINIAGTNYTQFVTERGSDRFPWQFYWDLALQADVTVFKEIAVGFKAEAFNLTDTQTQIGGSTSTNAALYGKATSRTQFAAPRNFRLTALVTF